MDSETIFQGFVGLVISTLLLVCAITKKNYIRREGPKVVGGFRVVVFIFSIFFMLISIILILMGITS